VKSLAKSNKRKSSGHVRRGVGIGLLAFVIALLVTYPSQEAMKGLPLYVAIPILLLIILTGVIFDIFGIAVAVADEAPFHALAAKKIPGAKQALHLVRRADRVSSFSNDVIGDVAGTIAGAAGLAIVFRLQSYLQADSDRFLSIIVVAIIAGITVGGKATGKGLAINYSHNIVLFAGKILYWIEKLFRYEFFKNNGKTKKR